MAPDRGPNRRAEFDEALSSGIQEFDPEGDEFLNGSSDSDSNASGEDEGARNSARDHYENVDKSRLRQPKAVALGAQYRGSRVPRETLTADGEEDDPFGRGFVDSESEEGDSASAVGAGDGLSGSDEDGSEAGGGEVSETSEIDAREDLGRRRSKPTAKRTANSNDRYELLKSLAQDQRDVASRLAQSTKLDAEKGHAVKKQRATFDSLLGTRIKLQKALIGANTVAGSSIGDFRTSQDDAGHIIERAEVAAFNLWSSLNNMREEMVFARTGEKRKRSDFTINSTTPRLWTKTQEQEESNLPHRNATLQRWSMKTKGATVQTQHSLLNKTERQATIIDNLQEHLANPGRLLQRAHTPRSCAPLQLASEVTEDLKIYDDGDFYGLLLKELLEQRSQDSALAANVDLDFNLQREAKTKKNVDTKASKGRKLRYTVHEKLQNFMAPEDRRTWGDRQSEELFGSLFGQRMGLAEEVADEEMVSNGEDGEDGLTLFRS